MPIYDPIAKALGVTPIQFDYTPIKDPEQAKLYSFNTGGYKLSEETKAKLRKPKSQKHREHISKAQKGVSVPTRGNTKGSKRPGIGGVKKGTVPWNLGKSHSPETREKQRLAALRRKSRSD